MTGQTPSTSRPPRCGMHLRTAALTLVSAPAVTAHAHGFGQRYDLPVPLSLYLSGAAAVVALSFALMAVFVQRDFRIAAYPHADLLRWSIVRAFAHPLALALCRAAAVAILLLVVVAGFCGNPAPVKNIAPLMVWAIWWVGMAYISALLGDLWALINPLDTVFAWAETIYSRLRHGAALALSLPYPPAMAAWPASILFFVFAWAELVWEQSDLPVFVATAIAGYCAITWTGMFVFGRAVWLERGEVFAMIFALLARFAPTEFRAAGNRRELNLRPYAVGLLIGKPVHASLMVLVIMMLATVTFDGFMETPLWAVTADAAAPWIAALGAGTPDEVHPLVNTLGLAAAVALFLSVYLVCARLIGLCAATGGHGAITLACYFVFTLVPIAIAYHFAHYLSFVVMAAQYLIPLASDPLGLGWDLFGSAQYFIRIGIVDARFVWYASVAAIVIGHLAAVYLAHAMALRVFSEKRAALRSQYPMLALMVGYTLCSLWIIAQPIVSSRFG